MLRDLVHNRGLAVGGNLLEIDMLLAIGITIGLAVSAGIGLWVIIQWAEGMRR